MCGARISSIDVLRGLIMALMALDHARAFVFGLTPDPTDLDATNVPLFLTRWITHLCAPGFILLAGVAARLQRERRGSCSLALLLATRGAWLIALELTVIGFGWVPDPTRSLMLLQVIWAIGWSMILLAPLTFLSTPWVGAVGVALVMLHPALSAAMVGSGAPLWLTAILLNANHTVDVAGATELIVAYPILPWFGVMAIGYAVGELIVERPKRWSAQAERIGFALLTGFVVLRAGGVGLDPQPWQAERPGWWWALSFLNCTKYPPSPLFLMMTLGLLLLLLALFERRGVGRLEGVLGPLGQAPLFFYALHLYALRIIGLCAAIVIWGSDRLGQPPLHSTPEWPLWGAWLIWALIMPILFLPTSWFASLKQRRRRWWTPYI